jgi:hypothetical protein
MRQKGDGMEPISKHVSCCQCSFFYFYFLLFTVWVCLHTDWLSEWVISRVEALIHHPTWSNREPSFFYRLKRDWGKVPTVAYCIDSSTGRGRETQRIGLLSGQWAAEVTTRSTRTASSRYSFSSCRFELETRNRRRWRWSSTQTKFHWPNSSILKHSIIFSFN